MTLPNDTIFKEYTVTAGQTTFTVSDVSFIPQDVDESLKVFIREDDRTFTPTNIDIGTDQINLANHSYSNASTRVIFTTTGTAPTGLVTGDEYYVQYVDKDFVTLALTSAGTPIDFTDFGTGVHTFSPVDPNGIELFLNSDFTVTKDTGGNPTTINFINRIGVVGQKLFITRESDLKQVDVDYNYGTPWQPVEYETHVDKIYAILQEQGNKLSRAILTRLGETTTSNLTFPVPEDNHTLGWYPIGTNTFGFRNYDMGLYVTDDELTTVQTTLQNNIDTVQTNLNTAETNLQTQITSNDVEIATNTANITANKGSIDALIASTVIDVSFVGNAVLTNGATSDVAGLPGSMILHFEIQRSDTTPETRIAIGTIKVIEKSGVYYISDPEYFIPSGNPPGVTFSLVGNTLKATSDTMGAGYVGTIVYSGIRIIDDGASVLTLTAGGSESGPTFTDSAIFHFEASTSAGTSIGTVKIMESGGTFYVSDPEYFIDDATPHIPGLTFSMVTNAIQIDSDNAGTLTYKIINI